MHLSYEHDVDKFLDGTRGMFLERIVGESELRRDGGVFFLDTAPERLPEAVFNFGQALTRVHDLTLLSRSNVGSTFYDDLADLLARLVDESKIQPDYRPDAPNAEAYRVDYRIESKDDIPLFLYGAPNRDTAILILAWSDAADRLRPPLGASLPSRMRGRLAGTCAKRART